MSKVPVAVIDIGSTAIRMIIAEPGDDSSWRRLDRASRAVAFGREVFLTGELSLASIRTAIEILRGFRELLDGWAVPPERVQAIATSAVREARNRDLFLDRLRIRTGFRIRVIEGVEENQLTFLAVEAALDDLRPVLARSNAVILEVGGGTTELMLLQRNSIVAAHSLRLGTVRIEQQVEPGAQPDTVEDYLRDSVRVASELMEAELPLDRIRYVIAVGGDARLAARLADATKRAQYSVMSRVAFGELFSRLRSMSPDEIVSRFGLTYSEADGLVPALTIYKLFSDATSADELIVPDVSIREGVLTSFALGITSLTEGPFQRQVIASARSLSKKFHYDAAHSEHVASLSLQLFDQLKEEHGLGRRERVLLEAAAILHDIGNYIQVSGHHKHGQYIVANSEIFGFSVDDIQVIGNLVRYHRKAHPSQSHGSYAALRKDQQIAVQKLSAILRVADALDRSHSQRVQSVRVELSETECLLRCESSGDLAVERRGLPDKADLFTAVFGYTVVLA